MYFTSNIVFLSHDSWVFHSSNDLQQTAGNLQFYVKDLLPRLTSTSAKVACFEVVRKVGGVNAWQGWGGRNPWNMFVYNDMCVFFDVCILCSVDNFLYISYNDIFR